MRNAHIQNIAQQQSISHALQQMKEEVAAKMMNGVYTSNGTGGLVGGGGGGSGLTSSMFLMGGGGGGTTTKVKALTREEMYAKKIAELNKNPAMSISLKDAFTLFAARWGMEWVFVDDQVPSDPNEMNWYALAERLYAADMAEKAGDCVYRLIERDHGNN